MYRDLGYTRVGIAWRGVRYNETDPLPCAGALGHPVWIMVPYCQHWPWGIGRDWTPWYPTEGLFHQSASRDWSGVVETIAESLVALSGPGPC
jgi:hypothetical protein